MTVINWATLVRRNVVGNGSIAVAGQDRTGTRLVAGLTPPALLSPAIGESPETPGQPLREIVRGVEVATIEDRLRKNWRSARCG